MELWLDTIDTKAIDHAKELGLLYGVTTNPDILSKTPVPVEVVLDDLLKRTSGPIAVQVTARTVQGMVDQGKDLGEYSQRIIVKVPVTEEGIQALSR